MNCHGTLNESRHVSILELKLYETFEILFENY